MAKGRVYNERTGEYDKNDGAVYVKIYEIQSTRGRANREQRVDRIQRRRRRGAGTGADANGHDGRIYTNTYKGRIYTYTHEADRSDADAYPYANAHSADDGNPCARRNGNANGPGIGGVQISI